MGTQIGEEVPIEPLTSNDPPRRIRPLSAIGQSCGNSVSSTTATIVLVSAGIKVMTRKLHRLVVLYMGPESARTRAPV